MLLLLLFALDEDVSGDFLLLSCATLWRLFSESCGNDLVSNKKCHAAHNPPNLFVVYPLPKPSLPMVTLPATRSTNTLHRNSRWGLISLIENHRPLVKLANSNRDCVE
jgi:hypothetical protein